MKTLLVAGVAAVSVSVAHANEAHRTELGLEWGGNLIDHIERWQALDKSGDVIEIRGPCVSACTMVMAFIPRERLCFGVQGELRFHAARDGQSATESSLYWTNWMIQRYPQDIRTWIESRGGAEKMTIKEFWTLDLSALLNMGYLSCENFDALNGNRKWR